MTITDTKLVEETGTNGEQGVAYHQTWHVYFTGGYSAAALVNTTNVTLPKKGQDKAGDSKAFASNVEVKLHDEEGGVDVGIAVYTVTYSQKAYNYEPNPLDRPPEIEGGGSELTIVDRQDRDGVPFNNSAGDLYDSIPEHPIPGGEITMTYCEGPNPAEKAMRFSNTMNAAVWHGVAAGNAAFGKITFSKQSEVVNGVNVVYWKVSYPIRFKRDGWRWKCLDTGFRAVPPDADSDDFPRTIFDDVGELPRVPCFLDGEGAPLPRGSDPVVFPEDGFRLLEEEEWDELDLDDPFA